MTDLAVIGMFVDEMDRRVRSMKARGIAPCPASADVYTPAAEQAIAYDRELIERTKRAEADRDRLAERVGELEAAWRRAGKHPEECTSPPSEGPCVSHMAYLEAAEERDRLAAELAKLREEYNSDFFQRVTYKQQLREAEAELSAARADAERIDWIDAINEKFQMCWRIGKAPAGNLSVQSVIFLHGELKRPTLRETIDAARTAPSAGGPQS